MKSARMRQMDWGESLRNFATPVKKESDYDSFFVTTLKNHSLMNHSQHVHERAFKKYILILISWRLLSAGFRLLLAALKLSEVV